MKYSDPLETPHTGRIAELEELVSHLRQDLILSHQQSDQLLVRIKELEAACAVKHAALERWTEVANESAKNQAFSALQPNPGQPLLDRLHSLESGLVEAVKALEHVLEWCLHESPNFEIDADSVGAAITQQVYDGLQSQITTLQREVEEWKRAHTLRIKEINSLLTVRDSLRGNVASLEAFSDKQESELHKAKSEVESLKCDLEDQKPYKEILKQIDRFFQCDHVSQGPDDAQQVFRHVKELHVEVDEWKRAHNDIQRVYDAMAKEHQKKGEHSLPEALDNRNRELQDALREVESLRGEIAVANKILRDSKEAAQLYTALQKSKAALEYLGCHEHNGDGGTLLETHRKQCHFCQQVDGALAAIEECL